MKLFRQIVQYTSLLILGCFLIWLGSHVYSRMCENYFADQALLFLKECRITINQSLEKGIPFEISNDKFIKNISPRSAIFYKQNKTYISINNFTVDSEQLKEKKIAVSIIHENWHFELNCDGMIEVYKEAKVQTF